MFVFCAWMIILVFVYLCVYLIIIMNDKLTILNYMIDISTFTKKKKNRYFHLRWRYNLLLIPWKKDSLYLHLWWGRQWVVITWIWTYRPLKNLRSTLVSGTKELSVDVYLNILFIETITNCIFNLTFIRMCVYSILF